MAANDTITNTNLSTTNQHRSVFLCPERLNPNADLNSITFSWILVAIIFINCPFTVLFNSLVIVALKKRRELEKRSNILLCSMTVTDLLTGAITMPLSATYELLILSQVPFEDICPIQLLVNKLMIFSLSTSSLYLLTAIAWERKMAVKSWINYRNNVTESRLTGLAIAAWLFGVITPGPPMLMVVAGAHRKFISMWLMQLERSLSDPTPTKCDKTCSVQPSKLKLQQRATISTTSAEIHHQRSKSNGTRKIQRRIHTALSISQTSVVSPKGMVNPSRVLSYKSWDNRARGNISNSRQKSQLNETTRRPKTAPSNVIHPNEKTAQH
ncbi:unnamed protein product [Pocillopora meandrina]|uniref:G-protein coupled receptors family 1 profile domain-containing protein n=1 Tax=Pocillopora meandrina TaxID=46732 RepID=A0AAU9XT02_9CNID|nr:unnamed protein product [Pocillopora meandrina]